MTDITAGRNYRDVVARSVYWQASGRLAGQALSWVGSLFVVRFLAPTDYGLAAIAGLVVNLGERLERGESIVFLAEREGKAVGFTQLYPTFCSVSAAPIFVLYDLFVAQEARRDGVARVLMQAATDYAARAGAVRLELATAKTNHAAQALYRSLGWTRDDVFDHYSLTIDG